MVNRGLPALYLSTMIHFTNGDSVVSTFRQTGIDGEMVAWRDVLHDGPVPAGLALEDLSKVRAAYIAGCGWGPAGGVDDQFSSRDRALAGSLAQDEIVLWFEHDLYDQLQLLQILDWYAGQQLGATRLSLVCNAEYLGTLSAADLGERFTRRQSVREEQLYLASDAWRAFRSPDPRELLPFLTGRSAALPFLAAAMRRQLQQFPDLRSGLSRSESQALAAIGAGHTRLKDVYFASHHRMEDAVFLGDTVFAGYIVGMSAERSPLVVTENGDRVREPPPDSGAAFWDSEVHLSNAGESVLGRLEDRIRVNGIDRWLGGVHLHEGDVWRWNDSKGALVRSD